MTVEAEESVLGAMLVAEVALTRVIDEVGLAADDFSSDDRSRIFATIMGLRERGKPVDELSVGEVMRAFDPDAQNVVSSLAAKVSAVGDAKHYAEIVQLNAAVRRGETRP